MNYRISRHAREEMERRSIPLEILESVLEKPQQVVKDPAGKKVYQSKVDFKEEKIYLVRVVTVEEAGVPIVLTVYRISKVDKEGMKILYDPEVDVLRIVFNDLPVEESDEEKPGLILDYDKNGNIVGVEILNASKLVENPRALEYAVAG
jgi:uncharacterized protein YuzE